MVNRRTRRTYSAHVCPSGTRLERCGYERTAKRELANRELESFTYSVSHDSRGPLRLIDGYSRILTEDYGRSLDGKGIEVGVCGRNRNPGKGARFYFTLPRTAAGGHSGEA